VIHHPPEISRSVVPPGGFYFEQALSDGSYSKIEGASLDHILELVLKYRQGNGMILPSGCTPTPEAVWADYNAWVCSKYPWLCTGTREPPPQTTETLSLTTGWEMLVLRAQRWVDALKRTAIDWVDQKSATDRAQICLACPQNVEWHTNCSSCNQNLVGSAQAIQGVRRTGVEAGLKCCRAFGTYQPLAVWLQQPQGDSRYQPPPQCWRLK
jgi:hypothetical protein